MTKLLSSLARKMTALIAGKKDDCLCLLNRLAKSSGREMHLSTETLCFVVS
jgi:hypothetical protein